MSLLSLFRRLWEGSSPPPITHTLVCGASRSGKSEAELSRLVQLARANHSAIVLLDPPGTLAAKFLLHLNRLGLTDRVIYDRLADTDRVPGYDWLVASQNPDPLQREAENDERIREFAAVLLRRGGVLDPAMVPLKEEILLLVLRLYIAQRQSVPLSWLADIFTVGSERREYLLRNCTNPALVQKCQELASLHRVARRAETAPAERILQAVLGSPAFRIRSGGTTFDFDAFLDTKGVLILDGSSRGNLSRDAAAVMMGAIILRVIQHCRTRAQSHVILVLDEAATAGLIGLYESQALSETGKWGLEFHILIQNPFNFPSAEIRGNVLQNCWRHEWFRQGSPEAARLAAEDMATPLLDPLTLHHVEYRWRTVDKGFSRVRTESHDERADLHVGTTSRGRSWHTVLWPQRKEVQEATNRYLTLTDQLLLMQKELMLLKPGYRFVRGDRVTSSPEYVPMLSLAYQESPCLDARSWEQEETRIRSRYEQVLSKVKQHPLYRPPNSVSILMRVVPYPKSASQRLTEPSH